MRSLARFLADRGHPAWLLGYPSTRASFADLSALCVEPALRVLGAQSHPVHVVGHSLGGLLARDCAARGLLAPGSRVVTLASPHAGSEVVDRLGGWPPFRAALGPAALELGTGADDLPALLPPLPVGVEAAAIAGGRSGDPWFNRFFAGAHDGKVSADSARWPEAKAFLLVPATHTFVMDHPRAQEAVASFLETGRL
jgi:triacylglycerol lipase